MNLQNLRLAISKSKDITLNFLGRVLSSTHVEPIRDDSGIKGIKASWVGEHGERQIDVDTGEWRANLSLESDVSPAIEYAEEGDTRSVTIQNIDQISCTVDKETLDEFVSPRGAAIAVCAGAAVGLLGWFFVSFMRALAVSAKDRDAEVRDPLPVEPAESAEADRSVEA